MVNDSRQQTRNLKPTSIYFSPAQLRKLDTLAYQFNEQSKQRIDRQDILRYLVERCSLDDLADIAQSQQVEA